MKEILAKSQKTNLEFEKLISQLEQTNLYDSQCPLCKKEKKSQWYIGNRPWWIVEQPPPPHGAEFCILACYWDHGIINKFKKGVLEYALRKIADQCLRIPYKIDRVCQAVKGHSHLQAYGRRLSVGEKMNMTK